MIYDTFGASQIHIQDEYDGKALFEALLKDKKPLQKIQILIFLVFSLFIMLGVYSLFIFLPTNVPGIVFGACMFVIAVAATVKQSVCRIKTANAVTKAVLQGTPLKLLIEEKNTLSEDTVRLYDYWCFYTHFTEQLLSEQILKVELTEHEISYDWIATSDGIVNTNILNDDKTISVSASIRQEHQCLITFNPTGINVVIPYAIPYDNEE